MHNYDTVTEALADLKTRGYTMDFNLKTNFIECTALSTQFYPDDFHVDEVHRFEGSSDPEDSSVLYAVTGANDVKGVLIDAYGAYASSLDAAMLSKLTIDSGTKY